MAGGAGVDVEGRVDRCPESSTRSLHVNSSARSLVKLGSLMMLQRTRLFYGDDEKIPNPLGVYVCTKE